MEPREARFAVEELLAAYVECIDGDRLEEWPDLFTEKCVYKIITWENVSQDLDIGWIYCDSRGMLQDRVTAHRRANLFAPHRYRHVVGSVRVVGISEDAGVVVDALSNVVVVRTALDPVRYGTSEVYAAGQYRDRVLVENGTTKFKEKIVVLDTARADTLLATPL